MVQIKHNQDSRCSDCPILLSVSGLGIVSVDSNELVKCCRYKQAVETIKNIELTHKTAGNSRTRYNAQLANPESF